jgi:enoyl-CoA hydratase/carnithine racemase
MLRGQGDKAFCAGGDIRRLAEDPDQGHVFFREEYQLDYLIACFPKPVVAIMSGIVMGGGVGISLHAAFRVVTDNTVFAMPETGIGLLPDVGASFFLGRLGTLGLYLGLTGERLRVADVMYAGVGTHYVPATKLGRVVDALCVADLRGDPRAAVSDLLRAAASSPDAEAPLSRARNAIHRCFGHGSVEAIRRALVAEAADQSSPDREWAASCLQTLDSRSPTSLKISFRSLSQGRNQTLREALAMEFRAATRCVRRRGDFAEGVRAIIIDKDGKPRWQPSTLEAVDEELVRSFFAPFQGAGEPRDLELPL